MLPHSKPVKQLGQELGYRRVLNLNMLIESFFGSRLWFLFESSKCHQVKVRAWLVALDPSPVMAAPEISEQLASVYTLNS